MFVLERNKINKKSIFELELASSRCAKSMAFLQKGYSTVASDACPSPTRNKIAAGQNPAMTMGFSTVITNMVIVIIIIE